MPRLIIRFLKPDIELGVVIPPFVLLADSFLHLYRTRSYEIFVDE